MRFDVPKFLVRRETVQPAFGIYSHLQRRKLIAACFIVNFLTSASGSGGKLNALKSSPVNLS